jgi:cellulose synthase/poly-beta-1,6-N-acetylglucosamine synthase-like glycosyltransferase
MLTQRYPDYEIVVVDDRSSDRTGSILDTMAASEPRLRVIHVEVLPGGWLGKNHALQSGADHATGDWLLFTDADIHLDPETLSRAIRYCEERKIDHLAIAPELILPGFLLEAFGVFFLYSFLSFTKPWKASDPKSWFFVGVGAFNLVRREAYRAVDGHHRIRLRPDDDLKLGKILKRAGFRQAALGGQRMLRVEWYHSLGEMIRGFEKNMFAGVDYSVLLSLAGGVVQLLAGVVPLLLVPFVAGPARWLLLGQIGWSALVFARFAQATGARASVALGYPIVVLLFVYILWRTMVLNLVQGGIQWRGTFYSLRELKANRI